MVRAIISAFAGRQRTRKAVIQAVVSQGIATTLLAPVGAFIANLRARRQHARSGLSTPEPRAAFRAEQPFFKSRAYEDEVVRLVMAYLGTIDRHSAR